MKLSTVVTTTALVASVISAVPANPTESSVPAATSSAAENTINVPVEAINNAIYLASGEYPLFIEENGKPMVLIVNATLAAQAEEEDADHLNKRDASPEAKWGWLTLRFNQPLFKRQADAEPGAKWGWLTLRFNQPLFKRQADAGPEAKWGWLTLRFNQPLF
ncbi:hypothetical protein BABINDRAFT_5904 [Babjeviella inositovora NRRL Y-12698]|uniref:Mating factor alpha precursor N-terminal domain-containing protein n=1 Tax=Babjeviella inositovora NRRL Y-12698 TaxID=984486 RepID=A0A1E3R110_9ASCO|nr:uncharacterized protein BABINDRAFT_5904 [Babjeviella inositovora NRRL Y-12698]ODQ83032.1 hypothetical protein BABINDRAFT_5904 [Babjeviella inositovora NRRL Y-12698]